MEIKLNVSEERFDEVLKKELEAFSPNELKAIIRECIEKKLMEDNLISNLLTYERNPYYGGSGYREPSEIMKAAAQQIDLSPAYKDIQDKMISYMKENYAEMMTKIMSNVMVEGITSNDRFKNSVRDVVINELCRRSN